MNNQKYPRTLNEAFPHTAQYGAAIEKPDAHIDRFVIVACIIAAVALLCMGAAGWLQGGAK